ncbi:MAG: NADH-quinone oxidoreductase subunit C [Anaerolineaceae bacterium]
MSEHLDQTVQSLQKRFDAQFEESLGETTIFVSPEFIIPVMTSLRDEFGFNACMDVTAVDYYPEESPRFHVVYQLYSMDNNVRLQVRTKLNGNAPSMDTVEKTYPSANWKEREVYDLFGVNFIGHSDLRRIEMPEDWTGHPLRKDYPLGYEEVQFTFNFDDIMQNKPQPKD